MELFPLAPSQGSRTCARWPLCLALGVVRRRMYLAAVASPTERPLRVVHPFLVPQCLKEPGLPSPDKLREYANVGSFRWSVLGRGMFIHASASGTRLQQNAHLRRVFLKKEEFTRRFESVILQTGIIVVSKMNTVGFIFCFFRIFARLKTFGQWWGIWGKCIELSSCSWRRSVSSPWQLQQPQSSGS